MEKKQRELPSFNRYHPNHEYVQKHEFGKGVPIPMEKKDTAKDMIKINPCVSQVAPKFLSQQYKKDSPYLKLINRIDEINRNFNLDTYQLDAQMKIQSLLQRNYTKKELKNAR